MDDARFEAMVGRALERYGRGPRPIDPGELPGVPPHERHFSDQLDRLRDAARHADPAVNLGLFKGFLDSLPDGVNGTIRFRAKANVGAQYLALGDKEQAVRWLCEACDAAPSDPRAVANRTLARWLGGEAAGAYRYGRERLAEAPDNKDLASYLPQIAVGLPDVADGLDGIPAALCETEVVIVAQAFFLRGRDRRPDWWSWVRSGLTRHPASEQLKLLAAFADVDELARDGRLQRTQMLRPDQRDRLVNAAAVLDADWQARPWLLRNPHDDAAHTLAGAMIAHRLLHDRSASLDRARRIADGGIAAPEILLNAVAVSLSHGEIDLAKQLLALAPDDPDLAFHAGVIAVQDDDWSTAAALFGRANVPESERRVVETAIALAPLMSAGIPTDGTEADPTPLRALLDATRDTPRGLVLVARVAAELGLEELAQDAFDAAVAAVPADTHIAVRLMVAAYAERGDSPTTVIRLLDGHLPPEGFEREHERLALAHANERPHRPRNIAYFETLPPALLSRSGIARAHASLLLDVDRTADAIAAFRRLHAADPTDSFVTLRLIDALHRVRDGAAADAVLARLDLRLASGSAPRIMTLAQAVARSGDPQRAYPVAYDLVRRNGDDPRIALGYVGLGLLMQTANPMFRPMSAGPDTSVTIEGPDGATRTFVIDEGGDFFGIHVVAPGSGLARKVQGLRRGGTVTFPKLGADPETWSVVEVVGKYAYLHRRIQEEFENRFPDQPGLARFTQGQDNIDSVLDVVRRTAEQGAANAAIYHEQPMPLTVVARGLGGDVVSFAQYVRKLGGDIVTCRGSAEERDAAMAISAEYRGRGAVLDPYTAWVAAEIGSFPALKTFFGTLLTPASTIVMMERMVERARDGLGRRQMSLSYHDGQFYRDEITDEFLHGQIAVLEGMRDTIASFCEVRTVLAPDEVSETAEAMLGMAGSRFLDAAFLSASERAILLSDDMRYREWATGAVGCHGTWIQAALLAALRTREVSPADYAKAIVGLAGHAHGHVVLSGAALYLVARDDAEGFQGLRTALRYLAGPTAEMTSHRAVFRQFLELTWPPDAAMSPRRTKAATGLALEAYLSRRPTDWAALLGEVIDVSRFDGGLTRYIEAWTFGHFITYETLRSQTVRATDASSRGEKSKRKSRSPSR